MRLDISARNGGIKKRGEEEREGKERKKEKKEKNRPAGTRARGRASEREKADGSAALFHCVVTSLMTPFSHARARVVAFRTRARASKARRSHALSRTHR